MKSFLIGLVFLTVLIVRIHGTLLSVSSDECSKSKTCMMSPSSCSGQECDHFLSWKPVNDSGNQYLEVELAGKVKQNTGYIAIGFSADSSMGDDAVVGCIASASGAVSIRAAYNTGHSGSTFVTSLPTGFLVTSGVTAASGEALLGGAFDSAAATVSCRFRRFLSPSSNVAQLKDLALPNSYFLLVSRSTSTSASGLSMHFSGANVVSQTSYEVASTTFIVAKNKYRFNVKLHASFMIFVWMVLINVAIIIARYFKAMWPRSGRRDCTYPWIIIHSSLQWTAFGLTISGIVQIFVYIKGYSELRTLPDAAHPVIGIIVFILVILNPIIGIFRPKPNAKYRPIFNWIHFFIGTLAQILSVTNLFIGVKLSKMGTLVTHPAPFWILVAYVLFLVGMEILFAIDHHCLKSTTSRTGSDIQMKSPTSATNQCSWSGRDCAENANQTPPEPVASPKRRSLLLAIYVIGVVGCATPLIVLVFLN